MAEKKGASKEVETKEVETKEVEKTRAQKLNETVTIVLPKDTFDKKEPQFVHLNGDTWMVPRGKPIAVPRKVYNILVNSMNEETKLADTIDSLVEKTNG